MGNSPKIRFVGFTDDWEQRKLGELATEILAGGDVDKDLLVENGRYPVIANALTNDGIVGYYEEQYRIKAPALTVTGRGDVGHAKARTTDFTPVVRLLSVKCNHDIFFLENAINNLTIVVESTGVPQLTIPQLKKYVIALPTERLEEELIGKLFVAMDNLITLHQRKCEKINNIKKIMLQKMFPRKGKSKPEIRFKEFTDDWELRKLEDYLEVSNEKNRDGVYTKQEVLSVSGDYGIVNQIEFQGRSFAGVSVLNYGIVRTGDVVYTKSPLSTNPFGIIKTNKGKAGIVSTLYAVYHPSKKVNPEFVQIYFELNSRMNNYMRPLVNKGAKNDMKVSAENALKGNVLFPNIAEQNVITNFFKNLDDLIDVQQNKVEELKNIKKFMLKNMFV